MAELESYISELYNRGASITEVIKAVRNEYGLTLGEAKQRVSNHPCFTTVVAANQPLHLDAIAVLKSGDQVASKNRRE